MLTACIWAEYKLGTVDPFWDPLSPEHGLPRNLVFVIEVVLCLQERTLALWICMQKLLSVRLLQQFSDRSVRALPLTLHSVNRLGLYHRKVKMARM